MWYVSHATVSYVLNQRADKSISEGTHQRVLQAAQDLQYTGIVLMPRGDSGEDGGSRATGFLFSVTGDTFQITDPLAASKRAAATPLPTGLAWKPASPKLVGFSLTAWPAANL